MQLERQALACAGIDPHGRCRLFALLVCFGILGSPRARMIRETLTAWFHIISLLSESETQYLSQAWAIATKHIQNNPYSTNTYVKGLMPNAFTIIIRAGWNPYMIYG